MRNNESVAVHPPENFARELLWRLEIELPVDLAIVASAIGLHVCKVPSTSFDGALTRIPKQARGTVAVRASIHNLGRERFTIAHEIGHYVLQHGKARKVCSSAAIEARIIRNCNNEEVAANEFASELLLPAESTRLILGNRLLSIDTAKFIASIFQTSLTAAIIQCVAVTEKACAAVVSVNGIVQYYKPSASWGYVIPVGRRIDKRTVAARLDMETIEDTGEVTALAWTTMDRMVPGAKLVENSIYLSPYNQILTILRAVGP